MGRVAQQDAPEAMPSAPQAGLPPPQQQPPLARRCRATCPARPPPPLLSPQGAVAQFTYFFASLAAMAVTLKSLDRLLYSLDETCALCCCFCCCRCCSLAHCCCLARAAVHSHTACLLLAGCRLPRRLPPAAGPEGGRPLARLRGLQGRQGAGPGVQPAARALAQHAVGSSLQLTAAATLPLFLLAGAMSA